MGRSSPNYLRILGVKGINQQERLADPELELYDARNFWAPNGRLEKRPGFWGAGFSALGGSGSKASPADIIKLAETPLGTFIETNDLSSLPAGSRWYAGFSTDFSTISYPNALAVRMTAGNSNAVSLTGEYWNGNQWAPLNLVVTEGDTGLVSSGALSVVGVSRNPICFSYPKDLALTTIATYNRYWLRFTVLAVNASVGFDASTTLISFDTFNYYYWNTASTPGARFYTLALNFPAGARFLTAQGTSLGQTFFFNAADLTGASRTAELYSTAGNPGDELLLYQPDMPASLAIVPEFGVAYVSYNNKVSEHKALVNATGDTVSPATVESSSIFVGPDAPYDPDWRPQLGSWPAAKYLLYHRGEMWAANLKGAPQQIRWSAGTSLETPGYKIWPQLSTEFLADTDQGPITGLTSWQDSVLAFKSDSIWQMVYTGLNGQSLNTYRPEKVVAGTGCVSNSSIQAIKGNLIFLGEDGIYRFDGAKAVKISDRIQKYIDSVVPARRAWASSLHWKSKSCYLLAVTSAGSDVNNLVLVWDYKNDSWWVWDGIEAVQFLSLEDAADIDHVYFFDRAGRCFELNVGLHDYGTPITGYVITERQNQDHLTTKARSVTFLGTNLTREVDVELQANDAPFLGVDTVTVPFTDKLEKEYSTAQYNVDKYTAERDRYAGVGEDTAGEWFRLKITHDQKDAPCALSEIRIGVTPTGVRQ